VISLRAVVFAYHNMGIVGIRALLDSGFAIPMVLSHADDPGENRWFGSVTEFCRERGIPVFSPKDVNAPPWPGRIRESQPDLLFSFYYRSMLKKEILEIPPLGAMNLHGSLLPKYRGLRTHQRVLEAGDPVHGASVHFVTPELDGGPVVLQARVPVRDDDDEARLAARVLAQEHRIYPECIGWFATGRLACRDGRVFLDGRALEAPLVREAQDELAA